MQRIGVHAPIGLAVIPAQQFSRLGLEYLVERFETGRSACADRFEIDHKSPCPLSGDRTELLVILTACLKIIGMGFERLPLGITLPLQGLAIFRIDTGHGTE